MRCCRNDWPGLCLFLLLSTLVWCQPTELIWAFFVHKLSNFPPPPTRNGLSLRSTFPCSNRLHICIKSRHQFGWCCCRYCCDRGGWISLCFPLSFSYFFRIFNYFFDKHIPFSNYIPPATYFDVFVKSGLFMYLPYLYQFPKFYPPHRVPVPWDSIWWSRRPLAWCVPLQAGGVTARSVTLVGIRAINGEISFEIWNETYCIRSYISFNFKIVHSPIICHISVRSSFRMLPLYITHSLTSQSHVTMFLLTRLFRQIALQVW